MYWVGILVAIGYLFRIERGFSAMAKSQADLDAAIDQLPGSVASAVVTSITPVIESLKAKNEITPVDFQPEIDKLEAIGPTVAAAVTQAISGTPDSSTSTNTTTGRGASSDAASQAAADSIGG